VWVLGEGSNIFLESLADFWWLHLSLLAVNKPDFIFLFHPASLQKYPFPNLHFFRQILSEDYLHYLLLPGDSLLSFAIN